MQNDRRARGESVSLGKWWGKEMEEREERNGGELTFVEDRREESSLTSSTRVLSRREESRGEVSG